MVTSPSEAQRQSLYNALLERRAKLRNELLERLERSGDASLQSVAGQVRDSGDESLARVISERHLRLAGRLADDINDVEDALNEIAHGEYGRCRGCGQPIALDRLQAEPTAKLCIQCKRTQERLQADTQTPSL